MRKKRFARVFVIAITALVVTSTVFGELVEQLWNALMPQIFGLHPIGFWQALGLLVLSWILLGGHGMFRGRGGHHWRHRMGERWEKMSPEDRVKFAQGLRGRCRDMEPPMEEATKS